ncbi:unnamed protein product, partial [Discosporangium mesarthrocarpum]
DVAQFLAATRRLVLDGVRMVLSGLIPVSEANPEGHRVYTMARAHGAVVEASLGRHTTHVVAARAGTQKVRW